MKVIEFLKKRKKIASDCNYRAFRTIKIHSYERRFLGLHFPESIKLLKKYDVPYQQLTIRDDEVSFLLDLTFRYGKDERNYKKHLKKFLQTEFSGKNLVDRFPNIPENLLIEINNDISDTSKFIRKLNHNSLPEIKTDEISNNQKLYFMVSVY